MLAGPSIKAAVAISRFTDSQDMLSRQFMGCNASQLLVFLAHGARVTHGMLYAYDDGREFIDDEKIRYMALSACCNWSWVEAAFALDAMWPMKLPGSRIITRMCLDNRTHLRDVMFGALCKKQLPTTFKVGCKVLICALNRHGVLPLELVTEILCMLPRTHFL